MGVASSYCHCVSSPSVKDVHNCLDEGNQVVLNSSACLSSATGNKEDAKKRQTLEHPDVAVVGGDQQGHDTGAQDPLKEQRPPTETQRNAAKPPTRSLTTTSIASRITAAILDMSGVDVPEDLHYKNNSIDINIILQVDP